MTDKKQLKVQVWIYTKAPNRRVLVLRTTDKRGGFWQPITGKVEAGESLENAAIREAIEETALPLLSSALHKIDFDFEFVGKFGPAHEFCFGIEIPDEEGVNVDPAEHVGAEWVTADDALKRLSFKSNAQALRVLMKDW